MSGKEDDPLFEDLLIQAPIVSRPLTSYFTLR